MKSALRLWLYRTMLCLVFTVVFILLPIIYLMDKIANKDKPEGGYIGRAYREFCSMWVAVEFH